MLRLPSDAGDAGEDDVEAAEGRTVGEFADLSDKEVAYAVARGPCLPVLVRRILARVEADPLASAGWFAGDLLRSLMEVPGSFWGRHPRFYDRYREALRAGAAARRRLPAGRRMEFWEPIPGAD